MPDTLRRAALAVLVLATVAAGCGPRSVALYEKVMGSPSYRQVTESATRTREVHDGLDTRFILSATWLSKPWVAAFAEEYSNIYYLDTARREQVISRWRQESEKHVLFFVALYVPEEKWNDLEKPGTLWSLRLVRGDEVDFEPAYVRKSSMHPEEIVRFFPYSGTWYRAYEVAFPREAGEPAGAPRAGSPRLKLVLSGVEGRAVLAWQ
ncbi:MAG TPA: hypothetical protein DDX05_08705 [Deltaproteobacteria bacterium]|nr:MAG: hypothetical protein A2X90_04245 [Deltaproteobacteria bacterium GWA2_65_63]OGP28178.1 MAG: hypothetical protein A2X91_10130 [Deltaproteobacteria bacterium GWB2_65_81]OGP36371.1 MAG: hypothetical protein A2X98_03380 [Deltaproteobacteria bacterium GWC2_66_88]HAM32629.1 hypothetical protein [Deltaproteobacteria bacterium]HBG73681.1 hypothetical protein [Deltaproteobacteria bacterium]